MYFNIAYIWMFAWNAAKFSFITEDLKGDLDIYSMWSPRISGWNAATTDVMIILDAHVEVVV